MAKIFSNIANKTTQVERFKDSTVGTSFEPPTYALINSPSLNPFKEIRNLPYSRTLSINSTANSDIRRNRIKQLYDIYTTGNTTGGGVTSGGTNQFRIEDSKYALPTVVTRNRNSEAVSNFYKTLPSLNNAYVTTPRTAADFATTPGGTVEGAIQIVPYTSQVRPTQQMLTVSRLNPRLEALQDSERVKKYLQTAKGRQFVIGQTALQTGNIFGQARQYNVNSVQTIVDTYVNRDANTPIERIPRLVLGNAISTRNSTSPRTGRLQKQTALDAVERLKRTLTGGGQSSTAGTGPTSQIDAVAQAGQARNSATFRDSRVGSFFNRLGQIATGLEVIVRAADINNTALDKNETIYDRLYSDKIWPLVNQPYGGTGNPDSPTTINFEEQKQKYLQNARKALASIKAKNINAVNTVTTPYGDFPSDSISSATYTRDVAFGSLRFGATVGAPFGINAINVANESVTKVGLPATTYVRDAFNTLSDGPGRKEIIDAKDLEKINEPDVVTFKIRVPGLFDSGIKFRAFLGDFNHTTKGNYDEVRYVGRPERYFTYKGAQRQMSFKLYLIAYGPLDIEGVWARCNMLNKLMYPIDNPGGFMAPPLTYMTVGNVITDQPGYVENIDMRLTDVPWDIDKELPQVVMLNLSYQIIEKAYIQQKDTNPNNYIQLFNSRAVTPPAAPQRETEPAPAATPAVVDPPPQPAPKAPPPAQRRQPARRRPQTRPNPQPPPQCVAPPPRPQYDYRGEFGPGGNRQLKTPQQIEAERKRAEEAKRNRAAFQQRTNERGFGGGRAP